MIRKRNLNSEADEQDDSLINLTPLIDVVFVVLIMFIIIAPLIELDRVSLVSSFERKNEKHSQSSDEINIYVKKDNSICLNNRNIEKCQLLTTLKTLKKQNPTKIPRLFNDKKSFFETYQFVKDAAEQAGFEQIDIVLKQK